MNILQLNLTNYFNNSEFLLIDTEKHHLADAYAPFAYTDILTKYTGQQSLPVVHFWSMEKMIVLGMKDTRVTHLTKGLEAIKKANYNYVVRNSGGLAVVADQGILNLSLIIPDTKEISITDAYHLMWEWMSVTFAKEGQKIEAFEVTDSYCPGEFDLSINGKKFAGIAQRRSKNGIAIMIYLSVNGPQEKRGQAVRSFYQAGLAEEFGTAGFPPVNPSSMANLADLLAEDLTVDVVKERLLGTLTDTFFAKMDKATLKTYWQSPEFKEQLATEKIKMARRNEILTQEEA